MSRHERRAAAKQPSGSTALGKPSKAENTTELYARGQVHLAAGRHVEALQCYLHALKLVPDHGTMPSDVRFPSSSSSSIKRHRHISIAGTNCSAPRHDAVHAGSSAAASLCRSCGCVRLSWVCSRRGSMVCRPELTTQLLKRISAAAHIGIECVHRIHEDPLPNQARAATVAAASLDRPVGEHRLPVFAAHDQAVDGRQKKRSASVTLPSSPLPSEVQRDLDGTLDQPRQRFAHKKRSAWSQNRS
jgi:hypothetical protein